MSNSSLHRFILQRARTLGYSVVDVCKRAGISRETFYRMNDASQRRPNIDSLIGLAGALQVHPMRLLQALFDDIEVSELPKPTASAEPSPDKSVFVSETIPDGTLVLCGQPFTKTWTMFNAGQVAWEGRYLQCMDEEIIAYSRSGQHLFKLDGLQPEHPIIQVPITEPSQEVTVGVNYIAPAIPGVYFSYWKSFHADGRQCFPEAQGLSVTVRVCHLITGAQVPRA
jgi:Ig-like domain from next to BRCA1 gene